MGLDDVPDFMLHLNLLTGLLVEVILLTGSHSIGVTPHAIGSHVMTIAGTYATLLKVSLEHGKPQLESAPPDINVTA